MIVAVTTVLNEAPIIGATCEHLLAQGVDHIIISDGGSTDGTLDVIEAIPHVIVMDQIGPLLQDTEMTKLAHHAADFGATWIVPFDADEFWCGVASLHSVPANFGSVYVPVYHHVNHSHRWVRAKLPKVAFRPTPDMAIEWGNHHVHNALGEPCSGPLQIRELQYRDYDHFLAKITRAKRLYDTADFPEMYGSHLRRLVAMTDDERKAEWEAMQATPTVYDPIPVYS